VGSTVPRSDTSNPAQHSHNTGSGCTAAGWSNSAGIGFPGCVRGSSWKGFSFDSGTRGVSGALKALVGGAGGASRVEGGFERGGDSLEGLKPLSEAETHLRA
jgi:hypothetical protein